MIQYSFFAYLARMRHIARWGLMRSAFPENVQEHSHMVSVLAHALAVIRRDVYGGSIDPGQVAAAALYHDAPEILTGDLPTPVKYFNPAIRSAYAGVEDVAAKKLLTMLPEELRNSYAPLLVEPDPETEKLVKAADKLAAYLKCVEETSAGNREFERAKRQTQKALEALDLPELRYFTEHFGGAFGLSLDELD